VQLRLWLRFADENFGHGPVWPAMAGAVKLCR
jgi:hypothetical protein